MPTLFIFFGMRFFFYSNEHLPIHIHIRNADGEAKFEVEEVKLIANKGIKNKDIKTAQAIIEENKEIIVYNGWNIMDKNEITIKKVWFDSERVYILTSDGNQGSHPLSWFPRLNNATDKERNQYNISPFGIHWPHLDEDLSIDGFFNYTPVAMKSK